MEEQAPQHSPHSVSVWSLRFKYSPIRCWELGYLPISGIQAQRFSHSCLQFILSKTWEDSKANEEVFQITCYGPQSSRLKFIRLRWAGHVNHIANHRIPLLLLHGVLEEGSRQTRRPRLRFKDVMKRDLKDFSITPESWTLIYKDWSNWRSRLHGGCCSNTTSNLQKLHEKRIGRHRCSNWRSHSLSSMTNTCPHTHTTDISSQFDDNLSLENRDIKV